MLHMKKRFNYRYIVMIVCIGLCLNYLPAFQKMEKVNAAENVVVVIDPGHGGTNLGTNYLGIPEKAYTLIIANYMKQELEKYDNVSVYMTRTTDVDMSLGQRADYAASVQADYLYSLHLNMSNEHKLYGAEVWIPSTGKLYCDGVTFGTEMIKEFQNLGIFSRGIKTKVNMNTKKDYYGIIRSCTEYGIPSAIVEHCHVDHPIDAQFYASQTALQQLGIADATAVAKYFGLKSAQTGINYGNYTLTAVPLPSGVVYQDSSAPEVATANLKSYDQNNHMAKVTLKAIDSQSALQYYSYSFNNGATWSTLYPWGTGNQAEAVIKVPEGSSNVIFQVYNLYDGFTQSNQITLN